MQKQVVDGVGDFFLFFFDLLGIVKIIYVEKGIAHRSILLDILLDLHI